MTLYWIQYFIIFIAMDLPHLYTYKCILRNPLTTFHQPQHNTALSIESAFSIFVFRRKTVYEYFCLQFWPMAKWHSSRFICGMGVFIRIMMTMMEMMILHTSRCVFVYLPICSIDTSQKPMERDIGRMGVVRGFQIRRRWYTKNNGAKVKLVGWLTLYP